MRHTIMAIAASLALTACGVEGDTADGLLEAEADQRHLEYNVQPTLTLQRDLCDCSSEPCKSSRACQGFDSEGVQTTASGNPQGSEPNLLILEHGDLFFQVTERGQFLVASDKGMENVMATIDGIEGDITEVVAYEKLGVYSEEMGTVGFQVFLKDGASFNVDGLANFTARESGYY